LKPKTYFETLCGTAFVLVYPALAFWGLMLYFFVMPGSEIRAVGLRTLFCSGVTIIVLSPLVAQLVKHIALSFHYSDRNESLEELKGVLVGHSYRLAADAKDYVVFEPTKSRFGLPGQIYAAFGEDGEARIVGPSWIVRDVAKMLGAAKQVSGDE
jgi:hypothetical protein